MGQAYSDPKRASMPHALPDVEVFWLESCGVRGEGPCVDAGMFEDCECAGWYWWTCFPGCMPDSDAFGPFETEQEALEDAQSNAPDDEQEGD